MPVPEIGTEHKVGIIRELDAEVPAYCIVNEVVFRIKIIPKVRIIDLNSVHSDLF